MTTSNPNQQEPGASPTFPDSPEQERDLIDSLGTRYTEEPRALTAAQYVAYESALSAARRDARNRGQAMDARDERWYHVAAVFYTVRLTEQHRFGQELNR